MAASASYGHIALDDIVFSENAVCPANGRCDFQFGPCRWTNDEHNGQMWEVSSNGTGNQGTGPDLDHTYGSQWGNYLHLATGKMMQQEAAEIISPTLEIANEEGICFQFWYFLNGR